MNFFYYIKKWLRNIKSFKLSFLLILYIGLDIYLRFFFSWFIYVGLLVLYTKLGVIKGRFESSLCPTRDWPNQVEFHIFRPAADQSENWIGSDGSCRKVVGSRLGLIIWKTARIRPRKYEKRQKSGQISPNPTRSWLDLVKSRRI